ncbi:hypothetical protein CAOG_02351 [Capsaspora owczarzaki ATCC 30864]|uniref:Uncharacterized protein n=1 Tax=Capsaspora owczarzaki (strain ATCC 30864) TaxID=595528 RepID=A0A0D2VM36_CAPO3|nr:hypothetical protein CAOG_02351 [Capsaspora owczarzaki ATCC 30864]KJE91177.1 hypothetical protein CAOG_002351 [Capsaspora owczarzaki ATCC 30864]|eukprot:XP_004349101.2 hypothetical protein CAOG_02351 [Capsaspora owczarzaki ATCC 30864]
MRLLTHNLLQCHVKGCSTNNYPLRVEATNVVHKEADFNPEFITHMLQKIEWNALRTTASALGVAELPEILPLSMEGQEELLKQIHLVLMETHIMDGKLVCPGCSHEYLVTHGVGNMLLIEDEV